MTAVSVWVLVAALAVGVVAGWAGIEPSPFLPGTNVLNSVSGVLGEVNQHLDEALGIGVPPSPCDDQGLIGKLSAMAKQLSAQEGRLDGVLTMVPPFDERTTPQEFVDALDSVRGAALGIARDAEPGLDLQPDGDPVQEALWGVYNGAWDIIDRVNSYLAPASDTLPTGS